SVRGKGNLGHQKICATEPVSRRDAFEWAVRGLEFHRVEIAYRQSKELRTFANQIVQLSGGDLFETTIEGPRVAEGYAPVVHVSKSGSEGQSLWIASRIVEIDTIHTELPSIAVFVPREDLVVPVAGELQQALQDTNIEVMPCLGGQVLGLDRHVRVFAVEHIKGLEFEAAFFHSLNDLAVNEPDLFDKYLYVGATRAATFLGLSCDGRLPGLLEQATQGMADRWSVAN
ncbi:MAG: DNA helicase UvrD, partial [Rhodobacteraceae bacterium]|nr:DNA helicase UvrD [Paracoccaceae bacterium]